MPKVEAQRGETTGELAREQVTIARFIARQTKAADEAAPGGGQAGFGADAAFAAEQFVRDAILFEHRDIVGAVVELLLGPEQLERTLTALHILERAPASQPHQFVPATYCTEPQ